MRISRFVIVIVLILLFAVVEGLCFYGKGPEKPAERAAPTEEEAEKVEQHAPTIEVGDTRRFVKESPLSASEEDDWYSYY